VFRFYMPVTCSKYTESKTHQNCRFLNHYIATGILKLSFGIFLQKYSISEVYYIYLFQGLSVACTEQWAHELCKVCCNASFPYKNPGLGRYLVGKGIPLLTTLQKLKEKFLHFFLWVPLYQIAFVFFMLSYFHLWWLGNDSPKTCNVGVFWPLYMILSKRPRLILGAE